MGLQEILKLYKWFALYFLVNNVAKLLRFLYLSSLINPPLTLAFSNYAIVFIVTLPRACFSSNNPLLIK